MIIVRKDSQFMLKQQVQHALVAAVRQFAVWLSTAHILLSVSFGRSAIAAAVAALASGVIDYIGAPAAGSINSSAATVAVTASAPVELGTEDAGE